MWAVEFTSDRFRPYLPEDAQVNPGVYGFELATWLSRALAEKGVVTSYPNYEDWGWFIEYISSADEELMIACASQSEAGEGEGGKPLNWHVFIRQRKKPNKKKASPDMIEATKLVGDAIMSVLSAEGIAFRQVEI
jgi:hypothetical protein